MNSPTAYAAASCLRLAAEHLEKNRPLLALDESQKAVRLIEYEIRSQVTTQRAIAHQELAELIQTHAR